jgi:hypothetical protein
VRRSPPREARRRSRSRERSPRRRRSPSPARRRGSRSPPRRRSPPRDARRYDDRRHDDRRYDGHGGRDARGPPPQQQRPRYSPPRGASTLYASTASNVVKIQGLPYGMPQEEVLAFFTGFEVKEGSLRIDKDAKSGSGYIKFHNSKEV